MLKAGSGNFGPFDTNSLSPSSSSATHVADGLENSNENNASPDGEDSQMPAISSNRQQRPQFQRHGSSTSASIYSSSSFPYTLPHGAEPSLEEAEQYFQIFRTNHLSFLPLLHLGKEMTSRKLRHERPFLWLCIMANSSTSMAQLDALGQTVREIAARQIIMEGERSMDLLLGLLCFIGWYVFFPVAPRYT